MNKFLGRLVKSCDRCLYFHSRDIIDERKEGSRMGNSSRGIHERITNEKFEASKYLYRVRVFDVLGFSNSGR